MNFYIKISGKRLFLIILFILSTLNLSGRENSSILYQKGAELAINGQLDQAEILFKKAISLNNYYSLAHYGLGKIYIIKYGMIKLGIKHLKRSVLLDKDLVKANFYLGFAYLLNQNYRMSIIYFKKTYDLDDEYLEALYNIGTIYEIIGKDLKSLQYYNKYLKEFKKDNDYIEYN
jgi:tetratricopeptide (TPR) repeat protein